MSEEIKKTQDQAVMNDGKEELNFDDLDQVSGGSIGVVRKERTKPINDDVASRFGN